MKKSSKNILLTHSSNDLYGASKILILIIEVLIKNGYSVFLILPEKGPLNQHPLIKKTTLIEINIGVFRKKYFSFFGLINRAFFIIKSTIEIKKNIKKFKIDFLYNNTSTIISSTFAAYLSKIPILYHVHEIPFGSFIYVKFIIKIFNNFSTKVIVVSKSTRDFWLTKGLNKNKVIVINNGFDFNFSSINNLKNHKIIFTNISRIIPYKGHIYLIDLFINLCKFRKDLILQIVGDTLPYYKMYLKDLEEKVKKHKMEKNIIFLGFRNDIKSILQKSSYFIHTPIKPDPFPTVIFEAIQSKIPILFTDKGGAREILDNAKNGLLIDDKDIKKSSKLILNYINNIDLQKDNIKNSMKFISKNFNKEIFSKKLTSLISRI